LPKQAASSRAIAHIGIGLVYEATGRKARTIAEFRKALLLDPSEQAAIAGLKRLGAKSF
jgi:hypothetical protein